MSEKAYKLISGHALYPAAVIAGVRDSRDRLIQAIAEDLRLSASEVARVVAGGR